MRKPSRTFPPIAFFPPLLCLVFSACYIQNRNFEITIVNPEPEAARVFFFGLEGETEVEGAWSQAFFQDTRIGLRAELIPDQRTVFLGWKRGYPLYGPDGTFSDEAYSEDNPLFLDIGSDTYVVSPRLQWVRNAGPHWIDADRIIFHSNRDGGEGIWQINPSGGPATRITEPETNAAGEIAISHRLDANRICGAWRYSPLLHLSCGKYPSPRDLPAVETILDIDSGESWQITASVFKVPGLSPRHVRYMSGNGDLVWMTSPADEKDLRAVIGIFSPGTEPRVLYAGKSAFYDCASAGTGRYAFIYSSDNVLNSFQATHLWILDSQEGRIAEAVGLRRFTSLGWMLYHYPVAISADGNRLLLSVNHYQDSALLGSSLALAGSDGIVKFLPYENGYIEAEGVSFRFSADGSSLIGRSLAGEWGRYSLSDGSLLESLPEMPVDASLSWSEAVYALENRGLAGTAADGSEPGGARRVESAAVGRNRDLRLLDPDGAERWLTGPGSGDDL